MGTSKYFTIALMAFFLLSGCKKDNGLITFSLQTSNYQSQEKTHMEYANGVYYTCWNDGDEIKINGNTATVSDGSATISVAQDASHNYFAIYPASCVEGSSVSSSTSITLPRVYEYRTDPNGNQIIGAPMAAKAVSSNNGQILFFKNLCTLLKIKVVGNVTIHNINIHSSNTNLSGSASVNINDSQEDQISMAAPSSGEKYVSLYFPNGYNTGSNGKDFYIPVPPLPSGETLHVAIVATYNTGNHIGEKNVYLRSSTMGDNNLPANLVIPMNMFSSSLSSFRVALAQTWLGGNLSGNDYRTFIDPGFSLINNSLAIEASFSCNSDGLTEIYNEFLYGNYSSTEPALYYMRRAPTNNSVDKVRTNNIDRIPNSNFFAMGSTDRIYLSHNAKTLILKNLTGDTPNDTTIRINASSYTINQPFYIMGANGNAHHFLGRCYYFRVSDEKGDRFYGIPVTVISGNWATLDSYGLISGQPKQSGPIPCMYDMVSGKFFSSNQLKNGNTPIHFRYNTEQISNRNCYYYPEADRL